MADEQYYVVEFRLAKQITEALSPDDAAGKAAYQLMSETGVDLSNWFVRVFEYGGAKGEIGVTKEYFSNPSGSKFRDKDGNIAIHLQRINEENDSH